MEEKKEHTDQLTGSQSEKVSEELKGSDADIDRGGIHDDEPTAEEAAEQIKGNDADYDQGS